MSAPERPRLTVRFGTRSKLFADVVHTLGERLYVETDLVLKPATRVEVEVLAPGLDLALVLEGTVLEAHKPSGVLRAGVSVRLAEASVERCRVALNVPRNETVRTRGRAEVRAEGQLPARVSFPDVVPGAIVRGLSANGLTLKCERSYAVGTHLELMVTATGSEVKVMGSVSWCRPELGLCGLHLEGVGPDTVQRLMRALSNEDQAQKPRLATVVVADDDAEIVELITKVVKSAGHSVISAPRGDVALEKIRKEQPALAFLDILMPGLDGLEVCRAVRADASLSRTTLVLLSAMTEQRLAEVSKAVGADAWLTKPMRIAAVRAAMEKFLR